nr:hypothetical protein [Tanacetum cinerariifolium]
MSIIPSFFTGRRSNVFDPFSLDLWDPFQGFPSSALTNLPDSSRETAAIANTRIDWKETPEAHKILCSRFFIYRCRKCSSFPFSYEAGKFIGNRSSEEYDLKDDCEAELDEITKTLDPHRDIEPEKVLEQHGDGEENNHHDGKETYLDNSDVDSFDEEIIEDENVKLRRTLVRFPMYDENFKIVTFSIGQSFTDHKQFKRALLKYDVQEKRDYIFKKKLERDVLNEYKKLNDYAKALVDTNPGTSVDIEIEHIGTGIPLYFKRMYVCLAAVHEGFLDGCRKYLGLDGCFLKGVVKQVFPQAQLK